MAGPSEKDINLVIQAQNLANKPIRELGDAVQGLVKNVETLAPASERGEVKLDELRAVATRLKEALSSLSSKTKLLADFEALTATIDAAGQAMAGLREKSQEAKLALANATKPTKELKDAVRDTTAAYVAQEKAFNRATENLGKLGVRAQEAGLDLANVAAEQTAIGRVFDQAAPAYERIGASIESFAINQRAAATAAREAASVQKAAAEAQTQAIAAQEAAQERLRKQLVRQELAEESALDVRRAASQEILAREEREAAAVQKFIKGQQEKTAAFKAAVLAQEAARSKDVEAAFSDVQAGRAAAAAREKKEANDAAAASARRWAQLEAEADEELRHETGTIEQATAAARGLAGAHEKAATGFKLFNTEGRESLSLYQRIRGEVLSLTAAYLGVFGAIQAVEGILEAVNKRNNIINSLAVAFGQENAAKEFDYVKKKADQLGQSYIDLGQSYAQFAIASRTSGVSVDTTRSIFERFSAASTVLHLSTEKTGLVFLALQQILSKGKVQSEELVRQLGETLPGALALYSKGVKQSTANVIQLLKAGVLTKDTLLNFANEVGETVGPELAKAVNSPLAGINRFNNALSDLKLTIADSGFLEHFAEMLKRITDYLRSPDGEKFAKAVSDGFSSAFDAITLVVDNLDKVTFALGLVVKYRILAFGKEAIFGENGLASFLKAINGIANKIPVLGDNLKSLAQDGFGKAAIAAGVVGAAIAGWGIGTQLYENSKAVRSFGALLIDSFLGAIAKTKARFQEFLVFLSHPLDQAKRDALNKPTEDALKAELERLRKDYADAISPENAPAAAAPPGLTPLTPEQQREMDQAAADAARSAGKARIAATKEIQDQIDRLLGEGLKKEATSVDDFVKALRQQYKPLFEDIQNLSDPSKNLGDVSGLQKNLTAQLNAALKLQAVQFAQKKELQDVRTSEQEVNDLIQERDALIANTNAAHKLENKSLAETKEAIAQINNKYNPMIADQAAQLLAQISKLPTAVQDKLTKQISDLRLMILKATIGGDQDTTDVVDRLKNVYAIINAQLQTRATKLASIRASQEAGNQTAQETIDKVKAVEAEYAGVIKNLDIQVDYIQNSKDLTEQQKSALLETLLSYQKLSASIKESRTQLYTAKNVAQDFAAGGVSIADAFAKAVGTTGDLKDGFKAAGAAFLTFAADFLLKIGEMIIQQQILNALKSTGFASGVAGGVSALAGAAHGGGLITDVPKATRRTDPAIWLKAARYHSGGVPGLRNDEVPTILQRGEEVLAKGDPRNARNASGSPGRPQNITIANLIDAESVTRAGLQSKGNEKVILNFFRANRSAIKKVLG